MAEEKTDVCKEVALIMDGVLKGLLSIPFPEEFQASEGKPEYITSHYCAKCDRYHRVYQS